MAPSRYSDADHTKSTAITHGVMAVLLTGAAAAVSTLLPWPWVVDLDDPDFTPLVAVPLILGAAGVVESVRALRWTRRLRAFGVSTLELQGTATVRLGGRLEGRVRTATSLRPADGFRVVLRCVEAYEFRASGEAAPARSLDAYTVWQDEIVVPAAGIDSAHGIPFRFTLPDQVGAATAPSARASAGSPYFRFKAGIRLPGLTRVWSHDETPVARTWQLDVSAALPGSDFLAQFVVPVQQD